MCQLRSLWEMAPFLHARLAAGGFVASSCHIQLLITRAGDMFGAAVEDNGYIWPTGPLGDL